MRITFDNRAERTGQHAAVPVGPEPTVKRPKRTTPCEDGGRNRPVPTPREADALASVASHAVIAEFLAAGHRHPEIMEVAVATHRWFENRADRFNNGRRSPGKVADRSADATCNFFHSLVPPAGVEFIGFEFTLTGGGRVDLLWRRPDGGIVVDELKLIAPSDHGTWGAEINNQIDRYLREGQRQFGDLFTGVRLLVLNGVGASEWRTPNDVVRLRDIDVWNHEQQGTLR